MSQYTQTVVPSTLLDNVIQFVEVSSLTAKRAIDEVDVHRQAQKRAADLRVPLLDHMIASGVVDQRQKQGAESMLGSHAETMQLLKAAVDKIVELKAAFSKKAGDNGEGVDPTSLGLQGGSSHHGDYNSITHPVVGEKNAFVKESDKPLLALIGK